MKITFKKAVIIVAVVYFLGFLIIVSNMKNKPNNIESNSYAVHSTNTNIKESKITISSVKSWFENQKNNVSSNFETYLNSQVISSEKISNTKVTDIELKFDNALGCYYILYFNCKVGTSNCNGDSRGFLKYQDTTVEWWSLEIDYKNKALIDTYEDSYEETVLDYYNELVRNYK